MFFILHQAKYTERKERQMKQMKKLASVLLLIAVVLTMTVGTAFAANVTNDTGHNYDAYQIFSGTQADNSVPLGDVKWGTGIKDDAFLSELKADSRFGATGTNIFKDCTTAADVAAILAKYGDKSEEAMAFANVAAKHLTSVATAIKSDKSSTVTLAAGYYLLVDTSMPGDAGAMNSALLQVTNKGDITIEKKYNVPTVDKSVKDTDGTWAEAADVNIGDDVSFKLVGTLPSNYNDYETYKFVFHDTMSKNLKLNGTFVTTDTTKVISGVTVKVGETDITPKFNITYSDNNLIIGCSNLKEIAGLTKDSKIVVEYTAKLLATAEIGQPGNENTVKLEYSNNPNYTGDGTNEPTSNTPEDKVLVFTYELDVTKVDGKDENKKLKDAEFVLLNSDKTKVAKASDGKFVEWVEDSTITKKNDGTYPAEYTLKSAETTGLFAIAGLDAGTYYLKETKAPAGYNLLKNPIKIVISATLDKSENNPALTALTISVDDDTAVGGALDSGIVSTAVKNNSGATLPETGGIGTTIFYVLGAALVIVAGVLLVTRRRMNKNN